MNTLETKTDDWVKEFAAAGEKCKNCFRAVVYSTDSRYLKGFEEHYKTPGARCQSEKQL